MKRNPAPVLFPLLVLLALPAAAQPPGRSICFVLDTSGSVPGESMRESALFIRTFVGQLEEGDSAGLIVFNDKPQILVPLSRGRAGFDQALVSLTQGGRYSTIYDAVFDAAQALEAYGQGPKAIVLITDGKDENSAILLEDCVKKASEAGVRIHAFPTGNTIDSKDLRRLSKLTGGQYWGEGWAADPQKAARLFLAEMPAEPSPGAVAEAQRPRQDQPPDAGPQSSGEQAGLVETREYSPPVFSPETEEGARVETLPAQSGLPRMFKYLAAASFSAAVLALAIYFVYRARGARAPSLTASSVFGRSPGSFQESGTADEVDRTTILFEKPCLVIPTEKGGSSVTLLQYDETITIGRSPRNKIVVNDDSVSAEHCQITSEGTTFVLQDRFSRNGTFLNGMRVDKVAMLQHGDVIRVGQTDIIFKVEQTREHA
jgi:hypothetical protein